MNTKPTQIQWRKDYEPFRGHVWNFGNYRIREEPIPGQSDTIFIAEHGGQRIAQSFFWTDVDMACERHANL